MELIYSATIVFIYLDSNSRSMLFFHSATFSSIHLIHRMCRAYACYTLTRMDRRKKIFGLILSYHPSFSVCFSCAQMFRISVSISQNILYRFVFVSNKDFMMDQINSVLVTFLMRSSRCEMWAPPIPYNATYAYYCFYYIGTVGPKWFINFRIIIFNWILFEGDFRSKIMKINGAQIFATSNIKHKWKEWKKKTLRNRFSN